MKFKTAYPAIILPNVDDKLEFFKESGFKVIHETKDVLEKGNIEYVLENDAGQRIDIVKSISVKKPMHVIRMNVDDYDESIEYLLSNNYRIKLGPDFGESYKCALLINPDEFRLLIMKHIEK